MAKQEFQRLGFISQEHYEATLRTLQSDFTGEYAPGGMTGCMMTRSGAEKVHHYFEAYQQNVEKWNAETPSGKYPARANLTAGLPPVFNQGLRGTCVAQAVTGLANYYFGKDPVLSAEYTFGVIKKDECAEYAKAYQAFMADPMKYLQGAGNGGGEVRSAARYLNSDFPEIVREGINGKRKAEPTGKLSVTAQDYAAWLNTANPATNENGSFLEVAHRVFLREGFCTAKVLPYNPLLIKGNSGHLPMPEKAVQDAAARRITDELHLFSDPDCIDEYKKFLSGNDGKWEPMPVAISVLCFPSWLCSPFTKRTGWFPMPIPAEELMALVTKDANQFMQENPNATQEQLDLFILKKKGHLYLFEDKLR